MKKITILLIIIMAVSWDMASADILIIGNKNVPDSVLSKKEIKKIFLGKRVHWSDNSKIQLMTLKIPEIHKAFLKQFLNKTESKWKVYWKQIVFTGRGKPPKSIQTEAELINFVAETSGAIGYISPSGISEKTKPHVKIIKIK